MAVLRPERGVARWGRENAMERVPGVVRLWVARDTPKLSVKDPHILFRDVGDGRWLG